MVVFKLNNDMYIIESDITPIQLMTLQDILYYLYDVKGIIGSMDSIPAIGHRGPYQLVIEPDHHYDFYNLDDITPALQMWDTVLPLAGITTPPHYKVINTETGYMYQAVLQR